MSESTLDFPSRDIYINNSAVFIRSCDYYSTAFVDAWLFARSCIRIRSSALRCQFPELPIHKLSNDHGHTKRPSAVAYMRAIYTRIGVTRTDRVAVIHDVNERERYANFLGMRDDSPPKILARKLIKIREDLSDFRLSKLTFSSLSR